MSLVSEHTHSVVEKSLDWPAGLWGEGRTRDRCQCWQIHGFPLQTVGGDPEGNASSKAAAGLEHPALVFMSARSPGPHLLVFFYVYFFVCVCVYVLRYVYSYCTNY